MSYDTSRSLELLSTGTSRKPKTQSTMRNLSLIWKRRNSQLEADCVVHTACTWQSYATNLTCRLSRLVAVTLLCRATEIVPSNVLFCTHTVGNISISRGSAQIEFINCWMKIKCDKTRVDSNYLSYK